MSRPVCKRDRPAAAPSPSSLVGVAPRTLALAHELARGSGMTVSEWLDRMVADADAEAGDAPPRPPPRASRARAIPARTAEPARRMQRHAQTDLAADEADQLASALAEVAARLGRLERHDAARRAAARAREVEAREDAHATREDEARVTFQAVQACDSLRALRRRMERVEWRTPPGSASAEAELARLKDRIARREPEQTPEPKPGRQLGRASEPSIERPAPDPRMAQLLSRVEEGQRHTLVSLDSLGSALVGLEQRVQGAAAPAPPVRVEAPPGAAPAAPAAAPADGALDVIEAAVRDLSDEVAASERRSAGTVGRMGEDVIRIAQRLDGRVGEVERRADARAAALAEEIARLAGAVEERLGRADHAQAQGLEGLGGKIADVAEQLAGRIADAERRNAEAVVEGLSGVGEQLRRTTEALSARFEQSAAELAGRVRESEARTARLVLEAGAPVEAIELTPLILGEEHRRRAETQPEVQAAPAVRAAPRPVAAPAAAPAPSPPPFEATRAAALDRIRAVEVDAHHPAGSLRAAAARILEGDVPPPSLAPPPVIAPPRTRQPGSTRELIENARAAARTAAETPRPLRNGPGASETGGILTLRGGLGLLRRRREGARA